MALFIGIECCCLHVLRLSLRPVFIRHSCSHSFRVDFRSGDADEWGDAHWYDCLEARVFPRLSDGFRIVATFKLFETQPRNELAEAVC